MNIIQRYLFVLCFRSFLVSFSFFTLIFVIEHIQFLVNIVIEKKIEVLIALKLFIYMLPFTASITIPIGILLGTILAFGQLSSGSEITAMRSAGFSKWDISKPVIYFGVCVTIFTFFFVNFVATEATFRFKKLYTELQASNPSLSLNERVFQSIPNSNKQISALHIDNKTNDMSSVIIFDYDKDDVSIIFAEKGRWKETTKSNQRLLLSNAYIINMDMKNINNIKSTQSKQTEFNIVLDSANMVTEESREVTEKSLFQLWKEIKSRTNTGLRIAPVYYSELQKKIAVPITCLIFVLVGMSLGMFRQRSGKGESFGLGLILIFVYYFFQQLGEVLGNREIMNIQFSVWLPNIVLAVLAAFFFLKKSF